MHRIIFSGCGNSCIEIDVTPDIHHINKELKPWKQSFNILKEAGLISFSVGTCVRVKAIKDIKTSCWSFGVGSVNAESHLPPNWRFRIFESYLHNSVCLEILSPTIPVVAIETSTSFKTKAPKLT